MQQKRSTFILIWSHIVAFSEALTTKCKEERKQEETSDSLSNPNDIALISS